MRALLTALVAVALLPATAAHAQFFPAPTGNGVSVGLSVPMYVERTGPVQSMGMSWTGVLTSPFSGCQIGEISNLTVRTIPLTPTLIAVQFSGVEFRNRKDAEGNAVYADYALQRVGDMRNEDGDYVGYEPMRAQLIGDAAELSKRQPSGMMLIKLGSGLRPGAYRVTIRAFLARYERTKLAGDLPVVGRMFTLSGRHEALAHYSIGLVVMDLKNGPTNDDELASLMPSIGMNPIMALGVNRPAKDELLPAGGEAFKALMERINALEAALRERPARTENFGANPNGGATTTTPAARDRHVNIRVEIRDGKTSEVLTGYAGEVRVFFYDHEPRDGEECARTLNITVSGGCGVGEFTLPPSGVFYVRAWYQKAGQANWSTPQAVTVRDTPGDVKIVLPFYRDIK